LVILRKHFLDFWTIHKYKYKVHGWPRQDISEIEILNEDNERYCLFGKLMLNCEKKKKMQMYFEISKKNRFIL
jgi:hypothetical protein